MHSHVKSLVASLSLVLAPTLTSTLALGTLTAQTQNIVYADGNSSPSTGSGNAFPWGSVGIRYQAIFPHSLFGQNTLNIATIRDILVAGNTTNLEAVYDDIEIRMGITKQATPTTTWSVNNPNPTTVYRGPLRIRFTASPSPAWGGIGLPKPYLYLPSSNTDNLCVEVIVWAASKHSGNFYFPKAGTLPRAYLYQWTSKQTTAPSVSTSSGCRMAFVLDNGNIAFAGQGCLSSANSRLTISTNPSWPQPGKSLAINLLGAATASPAFLVIGTKLISFDLGPAGAPTCFLWNDILVPVATTTGTRGEAGISAGVPAKVAPTTLLTHWVVFDKLANPAQLTSSDYATIIVGK